LNDLVFWAKTKKGVNSISEFTADKEKWWWQVVYKNKTLVAGQLIAP
jgi:hypothetical protein